MTTMKRKRHTPEQAVRKLRKGEKRELKELRVENAGLKKLLAEAALDKAMLKDLAEGKW